LNFEKLKNFRTYTEEEENGYIFFEKDILCILQVAIIIIAMGKMYVKDVRGSFERLKTISDALCACKALLAGIEESAKIRNEGEEENEDGEELHLTGPKGINSLEITEDADGKTTTDACVGLNEEALLQAEVAQMEEDNFRLVEDNYRRGRTGYLDLITALRDRADARARWQTAYFSAIRTHVQRLQLEGKAHGWLLSFEKNP
jgi:hypothetical protein